MGKSAPTYDAGERLPDLTAQEVRAVTQWARRAKAGQEVRLWRDSDGRLCALPIEHGDLEKA